MSLEDKFNAAVNVIRSLPKNGSYQPSNELMLRFYSYFKQATEGPCEKPKPSFWDVVNRAKWEAWNKLGDMSREDAMKAYVEELHKIVETMSYSNDVASFLSVDNDYGDFPSRDLELVAGDVIRRVQSEHNSPAVSRSISGASSPASPMHHARYSQNDSEDEFSDTVNDQEPPSIQVHNEVSSATTQPAQAQGSRPRLSNGHAHQITSQLTHLHVLEQLPGTLARLEADVAALRKAVERDRHLLQSNAWKWPWQELSPPTLMVLFVWPFVAYKIASRFQRRST